MKPYMWDNDLKSDQELFVHSSQSKNSWPFTLQFRMKGDNYKLISLQNITSELDEKEMEAQNLLRYLLTKSEFYPPIASLSDTVNTMLMGDVFGSAEAIPKQYDDVKDALGTINNEV